MYERRITIIVWLCTLTIFIGCLLLNLKGNAFIIAASIDVFIYFGLMITGFVLTMKNKNNNVNQIETLSSMRMIIWISALSVVLILVTVIAFYKTYL